MAKTMKYLIFTSLFFFSITAHAIEFYRCTDTNGKDYFTNLPASSLDANCQQKNDHFVVLLEQDYLNLSNEFKKYEAVEEETPLESIIDKVGLPSADILDAEFALEELLENTKEKRNSEVSKFFRARTRAIETVLTADPNAKDKAEQ